MLRLPKYNIDIIPGSTEKDDDENVCSNRVDIVTVRERIRLLSHSDSK